MSVIYTNKWSATTDDDSDIAWASYLNAWDAYLREYHF